MEIIRGLYNLRPHHHGCVATIGNFDGVHLGHQAIIRQLRSHASRVGLPAVVVLFEPQPREYFSPEEAPSRLMPFREKVETLAELGVDRVLCIRFNIELSRLTAQDFAETVLFKGLGVQHLVVGDDFHFGNDRCGDFNFLARFGETHGFDVENTHTFELGGERVSSTHVRSALEQGNFPMASTLMGREFFIEGRVTHGDKRGRTINVPTANILLRRKKTPLSGVYAVEVDGAAAQRLFGVCNVGIRPTVNGLLPRLEVHLLDYNGDLYSRRLKVYFRSRIRDEKKFASFDELKQAIYQDIETGRAYFSNTPSN